MMTDEFPPRYEIGDEVGCWAACRRYEVVSRRAVWLYSLKLAEPLETDVPLDIYVHDVSEDAMWPGSECLTEDERLELLQMMQREGI